MTGVALPPNIEAPIGVAQMDAVFGGKRDGNESLPHTSSKSGRYTARESLYAMQAISGLPISAGSSGGPCACSPAGSLNLYPVARESQKFPPKKAPWVALYCSGGKLLEYVYLCAVRLPARKRSVPG